MIEINLTTGGARKKPARAKSVNVGATLAGFTGRLRNKFLIGTVAVTALSAAGVGVMYSMQALESSTLDDRRDTAVRDSTRYANVLKDRRRAELVRDTLLRQVNVIRSIDEDRFVWPHVLDEISRALPQYTWLTAVGITGAMQGSNNVVAAGADTSAAAKKKGAAKHVATEIPKDNIALTINGRTVDLQAVTRFMRDLEASPFLGNVQLNKSELAVDQGKEVAQFQLTVSYTRPDTLLLHRVPLTLSVR